VVAGEVWQCATKVCKHVAEVVTVKLIFCPRQHRLLIPRQKQIDAVGMGTGSSRRQYNLFMVL